MNGTEGNERNEETQKQKSERERERELSLGVNKATLQLTAGTVAQ